MDAVILIFPGTNREKDMQEALEDIGGCTPRFIWHKDVEIGSPDIIILPGGFSYGDYLRCGAMAAHSPVMREVIDQARRGTPVLGVCNGFQILLETGLLPGALLRNRKLKFICKQTCLRAENTDSLFTRGIEPGQILKMPVAHGEGNYFAAPELVRELEDKGQIAFRYCNDNGNSTEEFTLNGSTGNIAGITNKRKTILGLMPHPENAVFPYQTSFPDKKGSASDTPAPGKILLKTMLENMA